MACVVVHDASCLIDLHKGGLLPEVFRLPYRTLVPLPIRQSEFLDISFSQWEQLEDAGIEVHDLTSNEVGKAFALKRVHPGLSANVCFCLVSALSYSGVLLTGDNLLRRVATDEGLEAHGVQWVIDELTAARTCESSILIQALKTWLYDDRVFLPQDEILKRLKHFDTKSS